MKWQNLRRSSQVEDRRGRGRSATIAGGGITIIAVIVYLLLGRDPGEILSSIQDPSQYQTENVQTTPEEDLLADMASAVLGSTEDVWTAIFSNSGLTYQKPNLVLFTGAVQSACGFAQAATGPFYCSGDQKVYLDLSFFQDLTDRFGASGDFAQAYVIAHEVGHHVQNLLGTLEQVHSQMSQVSQKEANQLSVRLELQADFYAGLWAHYADKATELMEKGDLEEALNAASQIGDDRIQKKTQGHVVPDAFTHGSSAQRMRWFKKGFETGNPTLADEIMTTKNL
ncbi:MAG: neutral zinc metallopeptidase [Bacteroidales bacterium]